LFLALAAERQKRWPEDTTMTRHPDSAATFSAPLGSDAWRCEGIRTWADVELLGRMNRASLREFVQESANRALSEGDHDALSETRAVLEHLAAIESKVTGDKPLLPRLRRETFRTGQRVRLYLGELPGAPPAWVSAEIVSIEKSFKVDWKSFEPNSGYYWRITASLATSIPTLPSRVSFSTSEPRVLPEEDFQWLQRALHNEPRFVEIFAANSRREWQPLWCQELGLAVDVSQMDPFEWLNTGS